MLLVQMHKDGVCPFESSWSRPDTKIPPNINIIDVDWWDYSQQTHLCYYAGLFPEFLIAHMAQNMHQRKKFDLVTISSLHKRNT